MFAKIKTIKNFGIFSDFSSPVELNSFTQYNLIYGWNGCGKTTLSKLFQTIETTSKNIEFNDCEFEIILKDNTIFKQNSINSFPDKIYVFNQTFIEENIDWKKQGAKSIVVISEDKIEERKRFFEIRDILFPKASDTKKLIDAKLKFSEHEKEDFLTSQARNIKNSFQFIKTSDSRYLNYDKAKLREFINKNIEALKENKGILPPDEVISLRQKIIPLPIKEIDFQFNEIYNGNLIILESEISTLLQQNIVSKSIARLEDYADINSWVEVGLAIHHEHKSDHCEFCGQNLPQDRLNELQQHFSIEYTNLMSELNSAKARLGELNFEQPLPPDTQFYEEFQEDYLSSIINLAAATAQLTSLINNLSQAVTDKIDKPFQPIEYSRGDLNNIIDNVITKRTIVRNIIDRHNAKTANFHDEINKLKTSLETHDVNEGLKEKKYFQLLATIETQKTEQKSINDEILALVKEMSTLEANLANVGKGAEDFNKHLHAFLGRSEICLEYDGILKGYKIIRGDNKRLAVNLSEGEKTAIAFIYFIIKVKENGNKIEDSIIVVDDPISSFDSNHLFHSFAYLKNNCEQAKQLFVLTHNFQYFRLIRDWLLQKNNKREVRSTVFTIDVLKQIPRRAVIKNAHVSLVKHGSEYHYIFKKLYEFKEEKELNLDNSYHVANYSRKLLEAFFTFKYPKSRHDFYQLMEFACKSADISNEIKEKVYRFINKYSHNQVIEIADLPIDNLLSEGDNITQLVLEIIQKSDPTHFLEMVEECAS